MSNIKTVHVVFKTHLDIGFTDLSQNVINQYLYHYIPRAIQLAKALDREPESGTFIWTTGSWLIHEFLRRMGASERIQMEDAIHKGHIVWHGLPFTTHTELMNPKLFEYGLSLSRNLDEKFGKKTIAAKMTDVPGHTRAIIGHMAKNHIQYLHLGVNPASKIPNVPPVFVWRDRDGFELIVNYSGGYGNIVEIDGLSDVLVFAHTGDNSGPPSIEDVRAEFQYLAEKFPGAVVKASSLNDFAETLWAVKEHLPVVDEEIGDSWIHGAATDPKKVAMYRALLRCRDRWIEQGRFDLHSEEYINFSDNVMLVAEHTWGMDQKRHLPDFKNYSVVDFSKARANDFVTIDSIPAKYRYLENFHMNDTESSADRTDSIAAAIDGKSYQLFESSWKEQRDYIEKAIAALSSDKQLEIAADFAELKPDGDVAHSLTSLQPDVSYSLGCFQTEFSYHGALVKLVDKHGHEWATVNQPLGDVQYETFGVENYHTWFEQYVENLDKTHFWADADFGKPGIENLKPRPTHQKYRPTVTRIGAQYGELEDCVHVDLSMPPFPVVHDGAPQRLRITYRFSRHVQRISVAVNWYDKQANRMPEATWIRFVPMVDNPNLWKLDKMGEMISPLQVVKNGNRNLHAVNTGAYYRGADGMVTIETLDAPVVSPGEPRLLQFDNRFAPLEGGLHFLLHNNIWGTNFPMWYEEDAKFRFILEFGSQ